MEWWSGKGERCEEGGERGHQRALRILNRIRDMYTYNFSQDTIFPDLSTVINQKYFLNNLLLHLFINLANLASCSSFLKPFLLKTLFFFCGRVRERGVISILTNILRFWPTS